MTVEEIIIQQAEEIGREEHLYEVAKRMVIRGKETQEIYDLLEVGEVYVLRIRKEILGR